jgi:hypothetical protein
MDGCRGGLIFCNIDVSTARADCGGRIDHAGCAATGTRRLPVAQGRSLPESRSIPGVIEQRPRAGA